jgi:hypothetical protein
MLKRSALIALAAVATFGLATLNAGDASAKSGKGGNGNHGGHGHHGHHHNHHHKHIKVLYAYKQWHRYSVVRPATTTYTRPTCTCLTKEYLPNGAVLFKDVCTNEAAMNPPNEQAAQTNN